MQRSVLALSVMALTVSASAQAEPLNIYRTSQGVPVRQAAAQGSYGGGFIEFLFGGGSLSSRLGNRCQGWDPSVCWKSPVT